MLTGPKRMSDPGCLLLGLSCLPPRSLPRPRSIVPPGHQRDLPKLLLYFMVGVKIPRVLTQWVHEFTEPQNHLKGSREAES